MSAPRDTGNGAEPLCPDREALDRRTFVVAAAWASAGLATPLLARAAPGPLTVQQAAPATQPPSEQALAPAESDLDGWHVDDMWGHRPRYAHAIPHGAPTGSPIAWEHVDPIDLQFVG